MPVQYIYSSLIEETIGIDSSQFDCSEFINNEIMIMDERIIDEYIINEIQHYSLFDKIFLISCIIEKDEIKIEFLINKYKEILIKCINKFDIEIISGKTYFVQEIISIGLCYSFVDNDNIGVFNYLKSCCLFHLSEKDESMIHDRFVEDCKITKKIKKIKYYYERSNALLKYVDFRGFYNSFNNKNLKSEDLIVIFINNIGDDKNKEFLSRIQFRNFKHFFNFIIESKEEKKIDILLEEIKKNNFFSIKDKLKYDLMYIILSSRQDVNILKKFIKIFKFNFTIDYGTKYCLQKCFFEEVRYSNIVKFFIEELKFKFDNFHNKLGGYHNNYLYNLMFSNYVVYLDYKNLILSNQKKIIKKKLKFLNLCNDYNNIKI